MTVLQDNTSSSTGSIIRHPIAAIKKEWNTRRSMIGGMDNMWIQLEQMSNFNPCCAAIYTFKGKMTKGMLANSYRKQTVRFPILGQRLTGLHRRLHAPVWEDFPGFDPADHITVATLPGKAGKAELEALMGELIAKPWDYSRPLWDTILVEDYSDEDGAESALLTRGHHSITDGQGFVLSQLYTTSFKDQLVKAMDSEAQKVRTARRGTARPSSISKSLKFLDKAYDSPALHYAVVFFMFALFWANFLASSIPALAWSIYMLVYTGTLYLLTCWRTQKVTPPQPGARVSEREFAVSKRFSMQNIKTIQKAFSGSDPGLETKTPSRHHATINDVMVSIMGDVLTPLIERQQKRQQRSKAMQILERILPSRVAFFIPISVRAPGDWSIRNLSTGGLAFIPQSKYSSEHPTPSQLYHHIAQTKHELNILKKASLPGWVYTISQLAGQAPILYPTAFLGDLIPLKAVRDLARRLVDFTTSTFHAILTNVPGPAKEPVTLEGLEVLTWAALPPLGGTGTLGLGVVSYAGSMCISVAADKVPGGEGIAREICEKFEARFDRYLEIAEKVVLKH